MKKLSCILLLLLSANLFAQNRSDMPLSFSQNRLSSTVNTISIAPVDVSSYIIEDEQNKASGVDVPWRFGVNVDVDIDVLTQGDWSFLNNGSSICRLAVESKDAKTLNIAFDKFFIADSAQLFIYSGDSSMVLGAYTSNDNTADSTFATLLLKGDRIILEYVIPASSNSSLIGELNISRLTHAYKDVYAYAKGLGQAQYCNVNASCNEGNGWENQIRSVCLIVVNGNAFCTGSLINNTNFDGTPYLLTAGHCYLNVANWVFWFNWDSPTCVTAQPTQQFNSLYGATLVAKENYTNFLLIRLNTPPPANFNVYYNGWDNGPNTSHITTVIHHPAGDVKKITIDSNYIIKDFHYGSGGLAQSHWRSDNWEVGILEASSAGAPFFDGNKRVIGIAHGGAVTCYSTHSYWASRFAAAWDYGNSANERLKDWLDPNNSGIMNIDGYDPNYSNVNNDASLLQIIEPEGSCYGQSSIISPKVIIRNNGAYYLTSLDISYIINNGSTPTTVHWTGMLLQGAEDTLTLAAFAIPSGEFKIKAYCSNPNNVVDEFVNNDTAQKQINYFNYLPPHFEDFETCISTGSFSITAIGILDNYFSRMDNGCMAFQWHVMKGPTEGANSGPLVDHTLSAFLGTYVYSNTYLSSGSLNTEASLVSPILNLNNSTIPYITFWYYMYGDDVSFLSVDICHNKTWINDVFRLDGLQQTVQDEDWRQARVDLTAYVGEIVKVRFRTRKIGMNGDVAIDDFEFNDIYSNMPNDIGIKKINSPTSNCCANSTVITPELIIANYGANAIYSAKVYYQLAGYCDSVLWTGTLYPSQEETIAFNQIVIPYLDTVFKFYTAMPNGQIDTKNSNDTSLLSFSSYGLAIDSIETFETFGLGDLNSNYAGEFENGWKSTENCYLKWNVNRGKTLTGSLWGTTGPTVDCTLADSNGKYLFIDASKCNYKQYPMQADLISPCLYLTNVIEPHLEFYYHKYGIDNGDIIIGALINNVFDTLSIIKGSTQFSINDKWLKKDIDLSAYIGQNIKIVFQAIHYGKSVVDRAGDMALDNIRIYEAVDTNINNNVGIIDVQNINRENCDSIPFTINPTVILKNYGADTLKSVNITVFYENNSIITTVYPNLACQSTDTITLGPIILHNDTSDIVFVVSMPNMQIDSINFNDTCAKEIIVLQCYDLPLYDNFEASTQGNPSTYSYNWTVDNTTDYTWIVNNDSTNLFPLSGVRLDHTFYDLAHHYSYTYDSQSLNKSKTLLSSPFINLNNTSDPKLEYWYHKHGLGVGDLYVDIYKDGIWYNSIDSIIGQVQLANDPYYQKRRILLSDYKGGNIKIRFKAIKRDYYQSNIVIDDISIFDTLSIPDAIFEASATDICVDDIVTFNNYSLDASSYKWIITPNTFIYVDSTDSTSISPKVLFQVSGLYSVQLIVQNSMGADTLLYSNYINVAANVYTIPFYEDFETGDLSTQLWTAVNPFNVTYFTGWQIANSASSIPNSNYSARAEPRCQSFHKSRNIMSLYSTSIFIPDTINKPELTFKYFHAPYLYTARDDSLIVLVSTDCSNNWDEIWRSDSSIATDLPTSNQQYLSTNSHYKKVNIDLSAYIGEIINISFDYNNWNNCSIYLDDISIRDSIAIPVSRFSIIKDTICPNELISFTDISTNTPAEWEWSFEGADSLSSNMQNPTNSWLYPGEYVVRLEAFNSGGLSNSIYYDTIVVILPSQARACEDKHLCKNDSTTLDVTSFPLYSHSYYVWSTGDTANAINVNPISTTTYSVTVYDGDCFTDDSVTVFVYPELNLGNDTIICNNEVLELTSVVLPQANEYYLWNTGDTTSSIIINNIIDQTYIVTITTNNCIASDTINVDAVEEPIAYLGEDTVICRGESVVLTTGIAEKYLWSTGDTTQSITVSPHFTTLYYVTVSNQDLCYDSDMVAVKPRDVPLVFLADETLVCRNTEFELSNLNTSADYLWSTGDTTYNISYSTDTNVDISLIITNSFDCSAYDTTHVLLYPQHDIGLVDTIMCSSDDMVLDVEHESIVSYIWSNGRPGPRINMYYLDYGDYYYHVNVIDTYGCKYKDSCILTSFDCDLFDKVLVSPNPVIDQLELSFYALYNDQAIITIFDSKGALVYKETMDVIEDKNTKVINVESWNNGYYLVKVDISGTQYTASFIVR